MPFLQRKNMRLKEYDYSQDGYYFVTICTQDRRYLFTELNGIGKMADYWWNELPNHFKNEIDLDEYVFMPNHIHGILIRKNVGADRCVRPIKLGDVIQWFKTMTTNEYIKKIKSENWPKFDKRIWQRDYYERIIRDEREYFKIKNYIKINPERWGRDRNNLTNAK